MLRTNLKTCKNDKKNYLHLKIFGFDFCLPADANNSNVGGAAAAAPTWTFNPQVNEIII